MWYICFACEPYTALSFHFLMSFLDAPKGNSLFIDLVKSNLCEVKTPYESVLCLNILTRFEKRYIFVCGTVNRGIRERTLRM